MMAGIVGVKIKGDRELMRALKRLPEQVARKELRQSLRAGGEVIVKEARPRVPVDEGKLRDGIHVVMRTERGQPVAKVATAKKTFWGHFIEFGTSTAAARPFLRPAAQTAKGEVVRVVRQGLWPGIKRQAVRLGRGG